MQPHPPNKPHGATGLTRILRAAGYSWHGLRAAYRDEAAFRQELILVIFAIVLMVWLPVSWVQSWPLLASALLVILAELLNSAIEAVVDLVSPAPHPLAKKAKDIGSAAVAVALLIMAMVWASILLPLWVH